MSAVPDRSVWFPKDFLLFVLLNIPLWGVAGLAWGAAMALMMAGPLIGWLFMGVVWGASCWFFFSIAMAVMCREVSVSIPLHESTLLREHLEKAVKRLRYTLEQQSPTSFICKPKHIIARLFEFQTLGVSVEGDSVDLVGPSMAVNKVRKQLLAKPEPKK